MVQHKGHFTIIIKTWLTDFCCIETCFSRLFSFLQKQSLSTGGRMFSETQGQFQGSTLPSRYHQPHWWFPIIYHWVKIAYDVGLRSSLSHSELRRLLLHNRNIFLVQWHYRMPQPDGRGLECPRNNLAHVFGPKVSFVFLECLQKDGLKRLHLTLGEILLSTYFSFGLTKAEIPVGSYLLGFDHWWARRNFSITHCQTCPGGTFRKLARTHYPFWCVPKTRTDFCVRIFLN